MKTVNKVLVLGWVSGFVLTALACSDNSSYSRASTYCNCLDQSLSSNEAVSGTMAYLQCQSYYDVSLSALPANDTITFKGITDPAHTRFLSKVSIKSLVKLFE